MCVMVHACFNPTSFAVLLFSNLFLYEWLFYHPLTFSSPILTVLPGKQRFPWRCAVLRTRYFLAFYSIVPLSRGHAPFLVSFFRSLSSRGSTSKLRRPRSLRMQRANSLLSDPPTVRVRRTSSDCWHPSISSLPSSRLVGRGRDRWIDGLTGLLPTPYRFD